MSAPSPVPAPFVSVVIPALDEEEPIAGVVREVLATGIAAEVIVVDNGSADRTAARAAAAGARVVSEPRRGYGRAVAAGVAAVSPCSELLVFLDGDGSDCPEVMGQLVGPVAAGTHDFVLGSRVRGRREPGSMNFVQLFAGRVAGWLVGWLYGVRFTDMSPYRAIRPEVLAGLGMREPTYGWNLEMQMRVARRRLRVLEIPVPHRRRAGGQSKVSGQLRGTLVATERILRTFWKVARER